MLQKLQWKRCVHATYANVKACLHVLVIHVHQYIIYTYMQRLHKRYSTLNYVTIHTAQHCITLQLQLPHTRIPHSWRPDIHAEQNNTTEHQTFTEHDQDIDDTLQCIIITQRPKKKKITHHHTIVITVCQLCRLRRLQILRAWAFPRCKFHQLSYDTCM